MSSLRQDAIAMANATDLELFERWLGDDPVAGYSLLARHNDALVTLFHVAIAHDTMRRQLVQATFRKLAASREPLRRDASVRTHLLQIARIVLIDHLRRAPDGSTRAFEPREHSLASLGDLAPAHLASLVPSDPLVKHARELPFDDALLLELYHWYGCSHGDLGKILGVRQDAVEQWLVDAEAALRRVSAAPGGTGEGSPYRSIQ